jgi:hypothetical protein
MGASPLNSLILDVLYAGAPPTILPQALQKKQKTLSFLWGSGFVQPKKYHYLSAPQLLASHPSAIIYSRAESS